jgi:pimeloyl-ACP methyl ester carboxylesterase
MRLNYHRGGSGEPLVLIHGIGSQWQVWEPVLARLEREREVVALDLPGFGASPPPPPGTPAGVPTLTDLVAEFLSGELGLERPHVAGNSLGGWISLELAKQDRVRSATALSPAGFQSRAEARYGHASLWLANRAARMLAARAESITATPLGRALAVGQVVAHPSRLPAGDAADAIRALGGAEWFDETLAALFEWRFTGGEQIKVPVTIAWGEKDRLLLPRQAARAGQAIPSARMVTLYGCGHVPTFDDPEQVAGVLLDGSGPDGVQDRSGG